MVYVWKTMNSPKYQWLGDEIIQNMQDLVDNNCGCQKNEETKGRRKYNIAKRQKNDTKLIWWICAASFGKQF